MAHEELRVIECRDVDLRTARGLGANLVINFCQTRYFSKRAIRRYAEWSVDRFDRLLIIVADHPQAHALHAFKGVPLDTARQRALDYGRHLAAGYRQAIPQHVHDRVAVALASDLLCHPSCAALLARVQHARARRPDLREALLASYLEEELAVVLHVSHQAEPRHRVAIVPCAIPSTLPRIYDAPFASLVADVTGGEGLCSVVLAEDPHPIPAASWSGAHRPGLPVANRGWR